MVHVPTYIFTPNTLAESAQVNQNFAELDSYFLLLTGGTMLGDLIFNDGFDDVISLAVDTGTVKACQVVFKPLLATPATPEEGMVYYGDVENKLFFYDGTSWNELGETAIVTSGPYFDFDPQTATPSSVEGRTYYDASFDRLYFFNGVEWVAVADDKGECFVFEPQSATPDAEEGKVYYDDLQNNLYFYNGVEWVQIGEGASSTEGPYFDFQPQSSTPSSVEGRTYYDSFFDRLYFYNGTEWVAIADERAKCFVFEPQSATPDAEEGKVYYDASFNRFYFYDGTKWVAVADERGECFVFEPQSATPDAEEGKVYYDDLKKKLYIYNGTEWTEFSTGDLQDVLQNIAEHEIELIELQANASVSPFDHDSLISETAFDADGYNGYINTSNTTMTFDAGDKEYEASDSGDLIDDFGRGDQSNWGTSSGSFGDWVFSVTGTGGTRTTDIVSGEGRMKLDSQTALSTIQERLNVGKRAVWNITGDVRRVKTSGGGVPQLSINMNSGDDDGVVTNGCRLFLADSSAITVFDHGGTSSAGPAITWTSGTEYSFRFVYDGTDLKAKFWASAGAEPGAFDVTLTTSDIGTGTRLKCHMLNGSGNVDNFFVDDLDGLGAVTIDEFTRADSATLGVADNGNTWAETEDDGSATWEIVSNKAEYATTAATGDSTARLDIGNRTTWNLKYRFNFTAANVSTDYQFHVNNSDSHSTEDGPYILLNANTGVTQLYDSTGALLGTGPTLTAGTEYFARFMYDGADMKMKIWAAATIEPSAFDVDVTNSNIGAADFILLKCGNTTTGGWEIDQIIDQVSVVEPIQFVEFDLPTITGTVTDTQLVSRFSLESDEGVIGYVLEDGSTNVDEGLVLDTKNALVNLVSNPTKLRIQIDNTGPLTNVHTLKTMALKLFKS